MRPSAAVFKFQNVGKQDRARHQQGRLESPQQPFRHPATADDRPEERRIAASVYTFEARHAGSRPNSNAAASSVPPSTPAPGHRRGTRGNRGPLREQGTRESGHPRRRRSPATPRIVARNRHSVIAGEPVVRARPPEPPGGSLTGLSRRTQIAVGQVRARNQEHDRSQANQNEHGAGKLAPYAGHTLAAVLQQ